MEHHLPYAYVTPIFFPEATAGKRPRMMPKRIITLIEKATSERQIADAWVSILYIPLCFSSIFAGEVVEPDRKFRPRPLSRLSHWVVSRYECPQGQAEAQD